MAAKKIEHFDHLKKILGERPGVPKNSTTEETVPVTTQRC